MANRPLYVIGHESYSIRWNRTQTTRPLRRSRSFKVTDFGSLPIESAYV